MAEQAPDPRRPVGDATDPSPDDSADYGSLSPEDDPDGTVEPGDLAGTAGPGDADVDYRPQSTQADPDPR